MEQNPKVYSVILSRIRLLFSRIKKVSFRSNLLRNPVIVGIGYKSVKGSLEKQEVADQ